MSGFVAEPVEEYRRDGYIIPIRHYGPNSSRHSGAYRCDALHPAARASASLQKNRSPFAGLILVRL